MNISPFIPALVPISLGILFPFLSALGAKRSKSLAMADLYKYPIGIRVFIWAGSVLFLAAPFCFKFAGENLSTGHWIAFFSVYAFLSFGGIYTDRYEVELCNNSLRYGAFFKKEISFSQITSMRIRVSNRGTKFCDLTFSQGGGTKLDGNMAEFDGLIEKLKDRVKGV